MRTITLDDLVKGCDAFENNESRDAMYRIARKLVEENWGDPAEVADGLGVVLLTWNQAAYRYGSFDFDALERFLERHTADLDSFRHRHIKTFNAATEGDSVTALFNEALDALDYTEEKKRTPVGAAKALHLLAPDFFPLWDQKIAKGCGHNWYSPERAAAKYVAFMKDAQSAVASLEAQFADGERPAGLEPARNLANSLSKRAGRPKTMLKFLDEYLYVTYTKSKWLPGRRG